MNAIRFQSVTMLHWLWLLPILVALLIFAARRRKVALGALIDAGLLDRIRISVSPARRRAKAILLLAGLGFLIFGLARPGWNPKAETVQRRGRDVVFLLDVSKSMLAEDLAPNRMERAKLAVQDAVDRLGGDRVGLVVFAGTAVVKCPLTLDYGFFRMMLEDVSTDSISRGGTLIGDALRKVLDDVFDDQAKQYKDIVLITDGEDHDSFPVEAAEAAGKRGVRLIAIGLGDENEGRRIPVTNDRGQKTFLVHQGEEVWTKLDAHTLRKMVNATQGGKYLNVSTGTIDLGQVYLELIATAEKKDLESATIKRYEEKFQIFLALSLILLGVDAGLSERRRLAPVAAAVFACFLALPTESQAASSVDRLVRQGNEAFAKGDWKTAQERYEEASVAEPESAWIAFNQGTVAYRQEDYGKALERFQDAAVRAKEPAFAAQAQYNMGNCAFRQAQRQKDSDLEKAIKECQASVGHFQDALRLDPGHKLASENIEIVRLYLKNLLDEQQSREEQEQQEDEIGKKLKELIERQQTAVHENGRLETARGSAADPAPPDWESGVTQLTESQEKLQADTADLLSLMQERLQSAPPQTQAAPAAPDPAAKLTAASQHVGAAVNEQGAALDPLRAQTLSTAQPHQTKALEELVLALQELSDPQQQQQQQDGQDQNQPSQDQQDQQSQQGQQGQQGQEGQDDQSPQEKDPKDQQPQDEKDPNTSNDPQNGEQDEKSQGQEEGEEQAGEEAQAEAASMDEQARDILNEEKENQQRRAVPIKGGRPVDKDW